MSEPIVIDLSKGWDEKEISKPISALPCSEKDKQMMEAQNHTLSRRD